MHLHGYRNFTSAVAHNTQLNMRRAQFCLSNGYFAKFCMHSTVSDTLRTYVVVCGSHTLLPYRQLYTIVPSGNMDSMKLGSITS
jgi:hypothetical protein